jgi:uncharacterized RDD family membrane protein YckC
MMTLAFMALTGATVGTWVWILRDLVRERRRETWRDFA